MKNHCGYTVLLNGLLNTTLILPASAVIGYSEKRELINVGSYVQFSAGDGEVGKKGQTSAIIILIYHYSMTLESWLLASLHQSVDHFALFNFLNIWIPLDSQFAMSMTVPYSILLLSFVVFHLLPLPTLFLFNMNVQVHALSQNHYLQQL